jgi:3-hydroxyacyl-[acyl-carrier-protein] dehydratase
MLATRDNIIQFIPQRPPIVMVDNLIEADTVSCKTSFFIRADNIFVEGKKLREPGLIESIAQSAAAHVGYLCHQQKTPVSVGYIAAIKNMDIFELPEINSEIRTHLKIMNTVFNITLVSGEIIWNERIICTCEMRIFITAKPDKK